MAYQYDVFLSYRRSNNWPRYVENHFFPMLKHWLDTILGRPSLIFFDVHDIETGEAWPYKLANGLACSKAMVCLWTKEYFGSEWCRAELTQMLARRKALAGPLGPPPLILAAVIHDSRDLDPTLSDIQRFQLQKYANPWMANDSPAAEQLSMEIEKLAQDVANALEKAPSFDPAWPRLVTDEFLRLFHTGTSQDVPPSLGSAFS